MDFRRVNWWRWQPNEYGYLSGRPLPLAYGEAHGYDSGWIQLGRCCCVLHEETLEDTADLGDIIREAKADTVRIFAELERITEALRKLKKAA